ncbi:MAG: hypothetical protein KDB27_06590 [Planctomycetales bacterium]|nr:hypothetical protein [Planctomycetales bacterium]
MNCPTENELFEIMLDATSASSDLCEHLEQCDVCQQALESEFELSALLAKATKLHVPTDAYQAVQQRIESHEQRKARLRYSIAVVGIMIVVFTSAVQRQSGDKPTGRRDSVVVGESTPSRNSRPAKQLEVSVASDADTIVVPVESESTEMSVFLIYPTITDQSINDSSQIHHPIPVARS